MAPGFSITSETSTTAAWDVDTVWRVWTATSASTTTYIVNTDRIWYVWTNQTTSHTWTVGNSPRPRTPAEEAAAAQRLAQERERTAQQQAERQHAATRALALLLACLDAAQQEAYQQHGYFDVVSETGQTYRIHKGISGNVKLLAPATGKEVRSYCAHPGEDLPVEDVVLAQKLMLEHHEAEFLRLANMRVLQ